MVMHTADFFLWVMVAHGRAWSALLCGIIGMASTANSSLLLSA